MVLLIALFVVVGGCGAVHVGVVVTASGLVMPDSMLSPLDYDFTVNNETVQVFVEVDGSVTINYSITFTNYGTDFEYIDIGFPNDHYDLSSVTAYWSLEGAPYVELTDIAPSSVITIGVEILVPLSLRPGNGETGKLLVWGNNPHMVYEDTEHTDYAGVEFTPTWFGSSFCRSVEYLGLHMHFPDGFMNGSMAYYHHNSPTRYYHTNYSLVYVWEWTHEPPQQHLEGISFPDYYVDVVYPPPTTPTEPPPWTPPPTNPWDYNLGLFLSSLPWLIFFVIPAVVCLAVSLTRLTYSTPTGRRRRKGYLPPAVKVEALGIRRGLTVVEAAILREAPLERVFTMIIFGMLKKQLIEVHPGPKDQPRFQILPQPTSKNVRYYERLVLASIRPNGTLNRDFIKRMFKTLIQTTVRKLEGYHRTDTIVYYTGMIQRAWEEMDLALTPDQQQHVLHQYAEWLLLDDTYPTRIKHYPHYHVPSWYFLFYTSTSSVHHQPLPTTIAPSATTPSITSPPSTGPSGLPPISTQPGLPTLSGPPISITNFANTFVLGTQNFANLVVTNFQNLANAIILHFRPPPPPKPSRPRTTHHGGGWGGGGGVSCACACACVSCACACAGGGR